MSLEKSWKRIVAWYEANVGPGSFPLAPGASRNEIEALEKVIGANLPDDFRNSMLLHNGGELGCWIPWRNGYLLSLDQILREWKMYNKTYQQGGRESLCSPDSDYVPPNMKGPIKPIFWNPRRVPVTENGERHLMLDLDPPAKGHYGQVISFADEGPRAVVAASWADFLEGFANDLETGKLVYVDEEVQPSKH